MSTYPGDLLKTVVGPRPPRPPVVLMTVWRPGAEQPPAAPMPGDRYGDDVRLGFEPVTGELRPL
jgi:hypothetical protein